MAEGEHMAFRVRLFSDIAASRGLPVTGPSDPQDSAPVRRFLPLTACYLLEGRAMSGHEATNVKFIAATRSQIGMPTNLHIYIHTYILTYMHSYKRLPAKTHMKEMSKHLPSLLYFGIPIRLDHIAVADRGHSQPRKTSSATEWCFHCNRNDLSSTTERTFNCH